MFNTQFILILSSFCMLNFVQMQNYSSYSCTGLFANDNNDRVFKLCRWDAPNNQYYSQAACLLDSFGFDELAPQGEVDNDVIVSVYLRSCPVPDDIYAWVKESGVLVSVINGVMNVGNNNYGPRNYFICKLDVASSIVNPNCTLPERYTFPVTCSDAFSNDKKDREFKLCRWDSPRGQDASLDVCLAEGGSDLSPQGDIAGDLVVAKYLTSCPAPAIYSWVKESNVLVNVTAGTMNLKTVTYGDRHFFICKMPLTGITVNPNCTMTGPNITSAISTPTAVSIQNETYSCTGVFVNTDKDRLFKLCRWDTPNNQGFSTAACLLDNNTFTDLTPKGDISGDVDVYNFLNSCNVSQMYVWVKESNSLLNVSGTNVAVQGITYGDRNYFICKLTKSTTLSNPPCLFNENYKLPYTCDEMFTNTAKDRVFKLCNWNTPQTQDLSLTICLADPDGFSDLAPKGDLNDADAIKYLTSCRVSQLYSWVKENVLLNVSSGNMIIDNTAYGNRNYFICKQSVSLSTIVNGNCSFADPIITTTTTTTTTTSTSTSTTTTTTSTSTSTTTTTTSTSTSTTTTTTSTSTSTTTTTTSTTTSSTSTSTTTSTLTTSTTTITSTTSTTSSSSTTTTSSSTSTSTTTTTTTPSTSTRPSTTLLQTYGTWLPWYTVECRVHRQRWVNGTKVVDTITIYNNLKFCDNLNKTYDEMAKKYTAEKIEQMNEVNKNTNSKLDQLTVKYETKDKASKSFTWLVFAVVVFFVSVILLNDSFRVYSYFKSERNTASVAKIGNNEILKSSKEEEFEMRKAVRKILKHEEKMKNQLASYKSHRYDSV